LEVTIRFFISPSQYSYGNFFGLNLPPIKLIPSTSWSNTRDRSDWYDNLIVEGRKISIGDLWGFHREDSSLGYVTKENMVSLNGWWQSNNLGARRRTDTFKEKPENMKRFLVFGDSFAHGSRIRQREVWSSIMDSENASIEVLNFGVDGYSSGQSFLRYKEIRQKVKYDLVLFMFVPSADLWRDINMKRDLGEGDWHLFLLMPRFILERGNLKLIRSPYEIGFNRKLEHVNIKNKEIKEFLKTYDRFYLRSKFEEPWIIGKSAVYKLIVTLYQKNKRNEIRNSTLKQDSEALQISKKIFETMNDYVKQDGNEFILIVLPTRNDLYKLERSKSYGVDWKRMVSYICMDGLNCIDLSTDLMSMPESHLDGGYDGTHYGPKTNRYIAESIKRFLVSSKIL
jgi:hypothetical protein